MHMHSASSSVLQNVSGSISAFACLCVALTYIIFKDTRNLRYVELVFYVSINDFVASIGMAMGGSETGSGICWFQSIVTNAQYLSSIFWSTVISYQLWLAVDQSKTIQDMTYFHLICWIFPVIVTFLPLTTNTLGNADDGSTWCFVSNRRGSPGWGIEFWDIMCYYLWVWLATLVSFGFVVATRRKLATAPQETELQVKSVAAATEKARRLAWYPIIISACWTVSTVTDIIDVHTSVNPRLINAATFIASMQGLLFSVVFFAMNPMIRHKWIVLFENIFYYLKSWVVSEGLKDESSHAERATRAPSASGRDTMVTDASEYRIEDEPDYIAPRKTSTSTVVTLELKGSFVGRLSTFTGGPPQRRTSSVNSVAGRQNSVAGPIRNPVVQQSRTNSASSEADEKERGSDEV